MNASQALRALQKIIGKQAAMRDNKKPSTPELRAQQRDARIAANTAKREAEAAMNLRRDELLRADDEYQRLAAAYKAAREAQDRCPFPEYRFEAGRLTSFCFSIDAQADNLAELVDKVRAKYPAKAAA